MILNPAAASFIPISRSEPPSPPPRAPTPPARVSDLEFIFKRLGGGGASPMYFVLRDSYVKNPDAWRITTGGHHIEGAGEQHMTITYRFEESFVHSRTGETITRSFDHHYHVYFKHVVLPSGYSTRKWLRMTCLDADSKQVTLVNYDR